jgi:hypothetical protein
MSGRTITSSDLDKRVMRCRLLKAEGAIAMWKLGAEIDAIHTEETWAQRMLEDGKTPAYKSFDQFCKQELGMTHGNAFELMDLSHHYDEGEIGEFGTKKLTLLLRAPEPSKAELKETIVRGGTVREVQAALKDAKVKHGLTDTKRDTGRTKTNAPATPKKRDKVSVAFAFANRTARFFTRATLRDDEPKGAKRVAEEPMAYIELTNRVTLFFRLFQDPKGDLMLGMRVKRDDP